jgi:hypothetical protein
VKRSLDVGIDQLGHWLKAINIGLIPLVLIAIAIAVAMRRRQKLKASRTASRSAAGSLEGVQQ